MKNLVHRILSRKFYRYRVATLCLVDIISIIISVYTLSWFDQDLFENRDEILLINLSLILISIPVFIIIRQYDLLTRFSGRNSIIKIFINNAIAILLVGLLSVFFRYQFLSLKYSLVLWYVLNFWTTFSRLIIASFLKFLKNKFQFKKNKFSRVAIYGAGDAGAQLAASLRFSDSKNAIIFIDDDSQFWGRKLEGIPIFSPNILKNNSKNIEQVFLAIPSLSPSKRREIVVSIKKLGLPILQVPSVEEIVSGKVAIDSMRPIEIEDLLGRDAVDPILNLLGPDIKGEVVLVSGAGGSIGSELCKQIKKLKPKKLILFERSEPSLYKINSEIIKNISNNIQIIPVLACANNFELIKNIINYHNVTMIFHAAAYKHVPLVEINPLEGISNNVFSTLAFCQACLGSEVKKFILISTDKAVRPTNIMGASKRLAELIVQGFAEETKNKGKNSNYNTLFSMVRFGNVLGSSGSVVPLFKSQINSGGPLTITHPDVVRYFMTIKEASQLVLQAASLSEGGDVFLLNMGEPVKIKKLAEQMVTLSGLSVKTEVNPEGDIEIIYTGLREGEKLFEELLINAESKPTKHPLIFKAREASIPLDILLKELSLLKSNLQLYNLDKSLDILSKLVPEWEKGNDISNLEESIKKNLH